MAPRIFFSCLDYPFIQASEDCACLAGWGWGRKGLVQPHGKDCATITCGAACFAGSAGALWWPMGNVQEEGCRRLWGIWKPAREAAQSLYRLPFVNQIIILTSNSMPLFSLFMGSCMESAEGKRMIQKYEDVLSLLEK